jgi:hypothetical protein
LSSGAAITAAHVATNKARRQLRQSIIVALSPTIFDCHIVTFDITGLHEALPKAKQTVLEFVGRFSAKKPDHRHCCLHARAASGHAAAAPPRSVMKSRRRMEARHEQ